MKIVNTIDNYASLPILAWPEFLRNQNGVVETGYFIDGEMVLPFAIRQKYILRWMQLYTEVLNCESKEREMAFLDTCMVLIKTRFRISHVLTSNSSIFKSYPAGAEYCKFGTYKVDLTQSEEKLFENLHSKHRNVIKKAQSINLLVEHGKKCAEEVVLLMNETYARQGANFSYGENYINRMNKMGDNVDWWVVKDKDGRLQGSAIFLWSKGGSCYYLHGGSCSHTSAGAMNLLIWKAMIEMKSRGVILFDFVGARITTEQGSKLEGIQRFKSRFGSVLEQGYMFRYIISPVRYLLYSIAQHLYYLLHGHHGTFDIIEQERAKGNY